MSLVQHLRDAADVAALVWEWLPAQVREAIESNLPVGAQDGRALLVWLAGVHDIGKATPPFASKVPHLADVMRSHRLTPPRVTTEFRHAPHGLTGHLILNRWMREQYGAKPRTARTYSVVVGGHHGVPPTANQLNWMTDHDDLLGDDAWGSVQREILDAMASRSGADHYLPTWAQHPIPLTSQALLTGAVIVADWMASNIELFPFGAPDRDRVTQAWEQLRLSPGWRPQSVPQDPRDHLARRFPGLGVPRPVQALAVETAYNVSGPSLMIIESGMGSGKTEAALLAAEVLARKSGAEGLFFGLPTMATSDGMFSRVLSWIGNLDGDGFASTFLAHGKSGLNDDYRGLFGGRLARVFDDGRPHVQAEVQSWLTGRKKGILANMVVGTVDQLLFAALQSKHAALRHLGLAGKVVIVDEVHAADDFMRMYLCRALEWLAAYGAPVILLSATLPSAQRQELVDAYRSGLGLDSEPLPVDTSYPSISTATETGLVVTSPTAGDVDNHVELKWLADDDEALLELLVESLVDGGCAAVIRNTVHRAQETARFLRAHLGDAVTLHHSRFLATHRASDEQALRSQFGPDGDRPPGPRIVVGTQVLEQSLDVDFDLLVTDLAPVDLVLQRVGRLHRHPRQRPARLRTAQVFVTGILEWADDGPAFDRGGRAVYGESRLLRSAGVLQDHGDLALPSDIRALVEAGYQSLPAVPEAWASRAKAADERLARSLESARARADDFRIRAIDDSDGSLIGWLANSSTEAEDAKSQGSARVRDGDDSIEVVIVQRVGAEVRYVDDGSPWAGHHVETAWSPHEDLARALAGCTLRLPGSLTRSPRDFDRTIAALEIQGHEGWQQSPWLAGQLVLHLDEQWQTTVGDVRLTYLRSEGLVDERLESAT